MLIRKNKRNFVLYIEDDTIFLNDIPVFISSDPLVNIMVQKAICNVIDIILDE